MDIPSAKPDIDPPLTVSNDEPLRGEEVTVSTVISNLGVVTAYDVLVRFEDNSSLGKVLIADVVVDELAPGSNTTVSAIWTATYPLGEHNISVIVDPLNEIPELNEDNNLNYTLVNVLPVPDLVVTTTDLTVNPASPVRDKEASISVTVRNIGDDATSAFSVNFYDELVLLGSASISNLPSGQMGIASVTWNPSTPGSRNITAVVDEANDITESNEANNEVKRVIQVLNYPDLLASSVSFQVAGASASQTFVNNQVIITATIYNIGESNADPFSVVFWRNYAEVIGITNISGLNAGTMTTTSVIWISEIEAIGGLYQNNTITAVVNPASNATIVHIPEMDDPMNDNNVASQVLLVIDNRPDLAVYNGRVQSGAVNVTNATVGENVHVLFDVKNVGIIGASNVNIRMTLVNATTDLLLYSQTRNFAVGETVSYDVTWVVNMTSGSYSIVINVDTGADSDQSDNVLDLDFSIDALTAPELSIDIDLGGKYEYTPGASIFVQGTVTRTSNDAPLANQLVRVKITDTEGFPVTTEFTDTTDATGQFYVIVPVPSDREGWQFLSVTVDTIEGEFTATEDINIIAPFTPETIPAWVYLLIVAIVIAVIVIFSLYLYRVGLGRMVECGNCGALIPEASKRCPKCGVQFETDTAKCSECGAWIPAKAETCPECGAKFMTEPVEPGQAPGYIEAMRKQYEEFIDGFREQAKTALGNKFSEEKFQEWLQTEPNYLPFEEWLRKEEMGRKSGVFPCPACGMLNPRDAQVCSRCGTVFEQVATEEPSAPKEEKKSPFRRIVRRSESKPAKEETKEGPKEEEASTEPKVEEGENKPQ
ncbi:MAG: hypothetical protein JXA45_06595 [Methanomassiliicoccales archaeon]|nr:hypothetical protein [Methanomassiliicoccales archaeon]